MLNRAAPVLSTKSLARMMLLAGVACVAGCAQHPKVSSTWGPDASRGQSFSTILVVGVSPNLSQRCSFERVLAKRLRSETTMTLNWIAEQLAMGAAGYVANCLRAANKGKKYAIVRD